MTKLLSFALIVFVALTLPEAISSGDVVTQFEDIGAVTGLIVLNAQ